MRKPKVFVGSTQEGLDFAMGVFSALYHEECDVYPWTSVFRDAPFATTKEQLQELATFDFGVIVFTPDDLTVSRGQEQSAPRDNLVFELGLLAAYLGYERTFAMTPKGIDLRLPSDLLGTNLPSFEFDRFDRAADYERAVTYACETMKHTIRRLGARSQVPETIAHGHQSGILIHPAMLYSPEQNVLRFRIGYQGDGSLLNANIRAYYSILTERGGYQRFGRSWSILDVGGWSVYPEIEVSWNIKHSLDEHSPVVKRLNGLPINVENLSKVEGQVALYVAGTDAATMTERFNRRSFSFRALQKGRFADFFSFRDDGTIENIVWDRFEDVET